MAPDLLTDARYDDATRVDPLTLVADEAERLDPRLVTEPGVGYRLVDPQAGD